LWETLNKSRLHDEPSQRYGKVAWKIKSLKRLFKRQSFEP